MNTTYSLVPMNLVSGWLLLNCSIFYSTYLFFIGVLLTLMLIYGWSAIFYAYVYSFFNKTLASSMLLFIAINFIIGCTLYNQFEFLCVLTFFFSVTGLFVNNMMFFLKSIIIEENEKSLFNFWNIFKYVTLIFPHFSYSSCIAGFLQIAWQNNRCKVCKSPNMAEGCSG